MVFCRCLLLPDFLLFAMLDPDGAGHLKPEIWHAFALRCLGLGRAELCIAQGSR